MNDIEDSPPETPPLSIDEGTPPSVDDGKVVKFEHKFFTSFPRVFFALSEQTRQPALFLKMGDIDVALPLPGIQREFMIADDSVDGRMLHKIAEALEYVRGLRIGDPLPKELFSSSAASWSPSGRHVTIAYQRLTMQLVTWLSGDEHVISNPEELMQVANDPTAQKKINAAFSEAAECIGLGRGRKQEVVTYIERMAQELSYIEALRDRFKAVLMVQQKVQGLWRLYGYERSMLEIADPVARLIELAVRQLREGFDDADAQTGEILAILQNIDNQIKFISSARNILYRRLLSLDEISTKWKDVSVKHSEIIPDLLRDTYWFLAPRFMQVKEWVLATQPNRERKKTASRGMVW